MSILVGYTLMMPGSTAAHHFLKPKRTHEREAYRSLTKKKIWAKPAIAHARLSRSEGFSSDWRQIGEGTTGVTVKNKRLAGWGGRKRVWSSNRWWGDECVSFLRTWHEFRVWALIRSLLGGPTRFEFRFVLFGADTVLSSSYLIVAQCDRGVGHCEAVVQSTPTTPALYQPSW